MRTLPRATGNAREIAFVPEAESSFLPISELVVADVALGREVARHPLGVARELWLGERGVAVRATAEAPLRFTSWDGRTITLPWTGDVQGIEAGVDAVIVRTHARGRIERRSFDALTGASSGDVTVSEAPRGVEIERTAERWRLVRGDSASSYSTRFEFARILRASNEEVLVSALHCLDRGDRKRGRILAFDRDLKMRRVISVPARDYEVVERTPTTLRLLAGDRERECEDAFSDRNHVRRVVPPELLEIELPR